MRTRPESSRSLPRAVTVVILTGAAVIGGLYLLWAALLIVGWCVGGCVVAVPLDLAVDRQVTPFVGEKRTAGTTCARRPRPKEGNVP